MFLIATNLTIATSPAQRIRWNQHPAQQSGWDSLKLQTNDKQNGVCHMIHHEFLFLQVY
jgi:hypothetical protein